MGISRIRAVVAALLLASPCAAGAAQAPSTASIVDAFAQTSIDDGGAVGIAVAVVRGNAPAQVFTYGYANTDGGAALAVTERSRFQIASLTKTFTTNVFGQEVSDGTLSLSDTLGDFSAQLGTLQPAMAQVTLGQLGDFTAGLPSLAPVCGQPRTPGCRAPARQGVQGYGARPFLDYFQNVVPVDEQARPPKPAALPAPYFYSDFSIGLLGLLLDPLPGTRLRDSALQRWFDIVHRRLLTPLGMHDTFLYPPKPLPPLAMGYTLALGAPVVSGGQVTGITLRNEGAGYTAPPAVRITGGDGHGAVATASVANGQVTGLNVTQPGTGYIARAAVTFSSGSATGRAIIRDGHVVAVEITAPGADYASAPVVTIAGGQRSGSFAAAQAVAHIANGGVSWVEVTQHGEGYVPPVAVVVAPGDGRLNAVPIWGAAGSLSTDIHDLARFTAAALGQRRIDGQDVPDTVAAGFRIAEAADACTGPQPALATCPQSSNRSALAWLIQPADLPHHYPAVVAKNGSLPGFTSQIFLVPGRHLAVAVLMNTRESSSTAAPGVSEAVGKGITAGTIARNVLNALLYQPASQ